MSKTLAEFLMPEVFVCLDDMPRSPSRKIDRKALPDPAAEDIGDVVEPETELEGKILSIVLDQIGTKKIGVTTSLISAGLSSLGIMRLSMAINQELSLTPLVSDIMKDPTIRGIAARLEKDDTGAEGSGNRIDKYEKRQYYPITENQRGIFIDWDLNRQSLQYNVPAVFTFRNRTVAEVESAIRTAMDAHSYLKVRLVSMNGEILQKCCDDEPVTIMTERLNSEPEEGYFRQKVRPFDLLKDELYRFELAQYKMTTYLFTDMHHIINDGLTQALFISDVKEALEGDSVPAEEITAFDFALYEEEWKASGAYSEAQEYFDSLLDGTESVGLDSSGEPDGKGIGAVDAFVSRRELDEYCKAIRIDVEHLVPHVHTQDR